MVNAWPHLCVLLDYAVSYYSYVTEVNPPHMVISRIIAIGMIRAAIPHPDMSKYPGLRVLALFAHAI